MSDDPAPLKRPALIELAEDDAALDPGRAAAPPDPADEGARGRGAMVRLGRQAAVQSRRSVLGRMTLWTLGLLVPLVLSVAAWDFVARLTAAHTVLGWIATVLVGGAAALLVVFALGEALAFRRIGKVHGLRRAAAEAAGDPAAARRLSADVAALYAGRPEFAGALDLLGRQSADLLDGDAVLNLTETTLLRELDQAALQQVERAARQVATVTALVPMALADVAAALFANLRMIRALSEIYGGRSSTLASLSLLRQVFVALVGAGAMALTDDLIGSFASGGVLAKLSRRFGEGLVNGALTVRVGITAMEACRPLPFAALPRPSVTATVSRALAGLFRRD